MRSELLRGKTAQVSAEHTREVRALDVVRQRAQRVEAKVRTHEDQFWKEISRMAQAQKSSSTGTRGRVSVDLGRALEAHKLLSRVKDEQKNLSKEVSAGLARVISSKVALSAFKKLELKEVRRHQVQRLERQGEEIGELLGSSIRRRSRRCVIPVEERPSQEALPGGVPHQHIMTVDRESVQEPASLSIVTPRPDLSIQSAALSGDRETRTLCVQLESRGVPVACSLSAKPGGDVAVVVESPHQGIVNRVELERDALATKLSALGIRVGRLDIKRGEGMRDAGAGFVPRRRRNQEERDENVIA